MNKINQNIVKLFAIQFFLTLNFLSFSSPVKASDTYYPEDPTVFEQKRISLKLNPDVKYSGTSQQGLPYTASHADDYKQNNKSKLVGVNIVTKGENTYFYCLYTQFLVKYILPNNQYKLPQKILGREVLWCSFGTVYKCNDPMDCPVKPST